MKGIYLFFLSLFVAWKCSILSAGEKKKEGISSFSFRYFLTMALIMLEQDNGKL